MTKKSISLIADMKDSFSASELKIIENRVVDLRKQCVKETGVQVSRGTIHYSHLVWWLKYVLQRFEYTSDEIRFNTDDYWDTRIFNILMLDDATYDDCDGAGHILIEGLIRIFFMDLSNVFRVACGAETGEPHFVAWAIADDGVYYQIENRMVMFNNEPRSVKFMKEFGYNFWYYSSMSKEDIGPNKWYAAKQKVMNIMYETPLNLASDRPRFSVLKALRVDKSKDLLLKWGTGIFAGISTAFSFVHDNAIVVASTVQAHKTDLGNLFDIKTVSIVMLVTSLTGIYIRTITHKDVDEKRTYDE